MPSTNGHGPKRALFYARVSTDEQARSGYYLAKQIEALRAYAAREGYEVLEEVKDAGQSGATLSRPGMDRVRDLVAGGGVAAVFAQDRDRFAREPAYHYLLRQELDEYGTKMCALNDRGDESPEGELTDGIMDQLAKFERAKTAERTRRGKLRKAREGKVVGTHAARSGFKFNATKDAYEINEAEMAVVKRIFYMVGAEGESLRAVSNTFERESLPTPKRAKHWNRSFFRACISDDVYRPHSFEEVRAVVAPAVAARLDPDRSYGLWWFNRLGHEVQQVSEPSANGRRYRKTHDWYQKPKEEWIAVPVPDSGIPREIVDAARAAIEGNRRPARAGRRFWELTGGIARCGECGWTVYATHSTSTKRGRIYAYDYYRCSNRDRYGLESCANSHKPRADKLEPEVWGFVSNLLKRSDLLQAGLERLIEEERSLARGNPNREVEVWAKKLAEVDRKRSAYQDQQAEGLITLASRLRRGDDGGTSKLPRDQTKARVRRARCHGGTPEGERFLRRRTLLHSGHRALRLHPRRRRRGLRSGRISRSPCVVGTRLVATRIHTDNVGLNERSRHADRITRFTPLLYARCDPGPVRSVRPDNRAKRRSD
jgi:site-specific DNA recombinase